MKRKNMFTGMLAVVTAAAMLCACGSSGDTQGTSAATEAETATAESGSESAAEGADAKEGSSAAESTEETTSASAEGGTMVYKVGILKFIDHPSLNQIEDNLCKQLDALSVDGVRFEYADYRMSGEGDASVLNQMAQDLIADQVDIIVPIATPAAQIVQAITEDMDLPVIFSAVSDPVSSGLAASMEAPGANLSGTSDYLNTNAIMDLMFAADPELSYVGLLYSKSEDASTVPIQDAKEYLDKMGVRYIEKTGTTTDEVTQAVEALVAEGVGAIFTPTDNTIQNAELAFFERLQDAGIPHYAGADSFALNGGFCGYGVDYANLGRATADMVREVLVENADPSTLPIETFENGIATINTETCEKIGFDLSEVKEAFAPYCTEIVEIVTKQEFDD